MVCYPGFRFDFFRNHRFLAFCLSTRFSGWLKCISSLKLQGRRHVVLFGGGGGGFMGTEIHLPQKFSFSSDFGHFILKMLENAKFSHV